jgi:hypothetical protein
LRPFGLTPEPNLVNLFQAPSPPSRDLVIRALSALSGGSVPLPPSITAAFLADHLLASHAAALPAPIESVEISCWDIDAFRPFKDIPTTGLTLPLNMREQAIKERLNALLDEWHLHKDWPGEQNDLFTNCRVNGRSVPAAFLLKGRSIPRPLDIKGCGKRGDQLEKLAESPADLLVVQHVHEITQEVRKHLRNIVTGLRAQDRLVSCCFIDGKQTFRLLDDADRARCLTAAH